jgi:hypothetical protein
MVTVMGPVMAMARLARLAMTMRARARVTRRVRVLVPVLVMGTLMVTTRPLLPSLPPALLPRERLASSLPLLPLPSALPVLLLSCRGVITVVRVGVLDVNGLKGQLAYRGWRI